MTAAGMSVRLHGLVSLLVISEGFFTSDLFLQKVSLGGVFFMWLTCDCFGDYVDRIEKQHETKIAERAKETEEDQQKAVSQLFDKYRNEY